MRYDQVWSQSRSWSRKCSDMCPQVPKVLQSPSYVRSDLKPAVLRQTFPLNSMDATKCTLKTRTAPRLATKSDRFNCMCRWAMPRSVEGIAQRDGDDQPNEQDPERGSKGDGRGVLNSLLGFRFGVPFGPMANVITSCRFGRCCQQ